MFKSLILIIFMSLVIFNLSCSEKSLSKIEVASNKGQILQKLIKEENYSQIYSESSSCMRSNYTESQFIDSMKEAVEKLKSVDETLEFWDFDMNEESYNDKWLTYKNYGIGFNWLHRELNKADTKETSMILTAWENGEGELKFSGLQVLMNEEEGIQNWYGTASCKTTSKEEIIEDGVTKTKTTVITEPLTRKTSY